MRSEVRVLPCPPAVAPSVLFVDGATAVRRSFSVGGRIVSSWSGAMAGKPDKIPNRIMELRLTNYSLISTNEPR